MTRQHLSNRPVGSIVITAPGEASDHYTWTTFRTGAPTADDQIEVRFSFELADPALPEYASTVFDGHMMETFGVCQNHVTTSIQVAWENLNAQEKAGMVHNIRYAGAASSPSLSSEGNLSESDALKQAAKRKYTVARANKFSNVENTHNGKDIAAKKVTFSCWFAADAVWTNSGENWYLDIPTVTALSDTHENWIGQYAEREVMVTPESNVWFDRAVVQPTASGGVLHWEIIAGVTTFTKTALPCFESLQ